MIDFLVHIFVACESIDVLCKRFFLHFYWLNFELRNNSMFLKIFYQADKGLDAHDSWHGLGVKYLMKPSV